MYYDVIHDFIWIKIYFKKKKKRIELKENKIGVNTLWCQRQCIARGMYGENWDTFPMITIIWIQDKSSLVMQHLTSGNSIIKTIMNMILVSKMSRIWTSHNILSLQIKHV